MERTRRRRFAPILPECRLLVDLAGSEPCGSCRSHCGRRHPRSRSARCRWPPCPTIRWRPASSLSCGAVPRRRGASQPPPASRLERATRHRAAPRRARLPATLRPATLRHAPSVSAIRPEDRDFCRRREPTRPVPRCWPRRWSYPHRWRSRPRGPSRSRARVPSSSLGVPPARSAALRSPESNPSSIPGRGVRRRGSDWILRKGVIP